jgi:hypothetical protein
MADTLCVSINDFKLVDDKIYHIGREGQVYSEYTKSGKHYIYAHFEADTQKLFYIGLGKYNRCNQINQRNKYWKGIKDKHGVVIGLLHVDLTLQEAKKIEVDYIKNYQPRANMTIGGEAGDCEKLRTKVFAYTKDGLFYKSFNSITEANVFFNIKENDSRIGRCLRQQRKSFAGYVWKIEEFDTIAKYVKPKPYNQRTVYRYDLNGDFVEKYDKFTDFKEGSHTGISQSIDTDYTFHNSYWRSYFSEKIEFKRLKKALKENKRVLDRDSGKVYDSISIASKLLNLHRETLRRKLVGERRNNTNFVLL